MMQPVVAYSPYPGQHPHQRLHHLHLHHHHAPPPPPSAHQQQQQQHHLLHQPPPQQTYPLHHDVYAPQPQSYHAPLLLAPAYRPLQIPMQQPQQQQQQQLQHSSPVVAPEQQQQLALAQQQQVSTPAFPSSQASAPDPGLHLHQQQRHHHHNRLHSNHSQHHVAAAYPQQQQQRRDRSQQSSMAYQPSEEEMAEMQRLSAAYESEATGPLVGQRQPSSAITQEYATADATYQTKTAALPQKYSHYRKVRGDGKCGWRAVAFGYLERLLYIGDSGKFYEEEARLRSLSNVLNQAGFEPYLYEDFADELFGLIRSIANAINEGNGDEVLMNAFNDESTQNYVITHFKTLTAAWMKTHPENYAGYMIGQTVDQYCDEHIMPMDGEIDHLGLSALKDVILSPASLALEVTYLDRSVGEEVNLHRFDPISGYTASTVRLLYRPFVSHLTCTPRSLLTKTSGHYDLLYKYEDVPLPTPPPPPPAQESVAAYLQQNAPHPDYVPIGDFSDATDNLMFIPGMSIAPTHGWMSGPSYGSDFFATPFAPVQSCAQTLPSPVASAPQPQMLQQAPIQPAYTSAPQVSHVLPPTQMPTDLPIRSSGAMPHAEHVIESQPEPQCQTGGMFRPSVYNSTVDGYAASIPQMPLVTPSFKNSHYNPSHFQNPDFQPEQWVPDDEYVTTTSTKASSRSHRSSG